MCQALREAISKRKVGIHDLSVQVEFPHTGVILILAPSCKRGDFAAAKKIIEQFVGKMIRRDVVIPCNDKVVALILKKKSNLLKEALPLELSKKLMFLFVLLLKLSSRVANLILRLLKLALGFL